MLKWFKRKNKAAKKSKENLREEAEAPLGEEFPAEDQIPPDAAALGEDRLSSEHREPGEEDFPGDIEPADDEGFAPADEELPEEYDEESEYLDEYEEEEAAEAPVKEKRRFFKKLRERLRKTREKFASRVDRLVLGKKIIDADMLDELEEVLITSDLGVRTTQLLLQKVTEKIKRQELKDPQKLREALRDEIRTILTVPSSAFDLTAHHPSVVMVIGVNGVGKTTTIGKLAHQWKQDGHKVMLVAADTFRAAAVEQLALWAERADVPLVSQKSGSDPSAVVFDAMDAAASRDVGVVLIDTAGRMHTKVNLMEELKKVHRVIIRKMPEAPHEVLLVLDASTGQNALSQAKLFKEGIGLTGLILTKLDGTAKGGIVVAICDELQVPVRFIGIGEGIEDLKPFDPDEFAKALL